MPVRVITSSDIRPPRQALTVRRRSVRPSRTAVRMAFSVMSAPQGLSGSAAHTPGLTQKKSSGDSGSVAQPVSMSAAASAARPLKEADVIVDAPPCMCYVL